MKKIVLHEYQKNIPLYKKGLYWGVGSGKSYAALEFVRRKEAKKLLIICPKNMFSEWGAAVKEFKYSFNLGTDFLKDENIIIFNSESLHKLEIDYTDYFVVIDEVHLLYKNIKAKKTKYFLKHVSPKIKDNILLLTGTPVKNNEVDLFSQHAIANNFFLRGANYTSFSSDSNKIKNINDFINEFMLTKSIKLNTGRIFNKIIGLNPKKRELLYSQVNSFWCFKEHKVDVKSQYFTIGIQPDNQFIEKQNKLKNGIKVERGVAYALNYITQSLIYCRQLADGFLYDSEKKAEHKNDLKIKALLNLLASNDYNITGGVLIFSVFIASRHIIYKTLNEKGFTVYMYEGDSKVIEQFKDCNSRLKILISSQSLMSTGLNLQTANHIIFYSNDYDYSTRLQAEGRIRRQGQEKPCFFYDLVINNSMDVEILKIIRNKEVNIKKLVDFIKEN